MILNKEKLKIVDANDEISDLIEIHYDSKKVGFVRGIGNSITYNIIHISVDSAYQKNGLGLILEKKIIDFAKNKGYQLIEAHTSSNNIASIALHKKAGFKIYDIGSQYYLSMILNE